MFVETLPAIMRTSEGLRAPWGLWGVPAAPCISPDPPRPGAAPARSRKGRGGQEGWGRWGRWAPGLGGRPAWAAPGGQRCSPAPAKAGPPRAPRGHGAAAWPGLHPRAAAGRLPGGGGGGGGRGIPAGAPGPARSPLATFAALLSGLLRQPVPNSPQAPSASPQFPGFRPPGVGRVSAPRWLWVRISTGHLTRVSVRVT